MSHCIIQYCTTKTRAGITQSVQRLATGWTVRGSNPGGGTRFSAPVQTGSDAHPASCTIGTESLLGVKRPERGVDDPPHLEPRLKKEQSYTSTPPFWDFVACYRVNFTFTFTTTTVATDYSPVPIVSNSSKSFFPPQCHHMSSQTSWSLSPPPGCD